MSLKSKLCPRCRKTFGLESRTCDRDGWRLTVDRSGQLVAGRFLIESFLGAGGGGASVWQATELSRSTPIALKVLHEADATSGRRFERGAHLAMELDHPAVASVYEFGHFHDLMYVAMERLAGHTLQEHLKVDRGLEPTLAVGLVAQALEALSVAHGRGIIHRDFKPGNVFILDGAMLGAVPRIKLLDFGIARLEPEVARLRLAEAGDQASETHDRYVPGRAITADQHICGTPEYMAPEQILGAEPRPTMDIYSAGVVLYRLLTGKVPFRARDRVELYHCHLAMAPPPFPRNLAIPSALEAEVLRALSKKPEDRHSSAEALRSAILDAAGASVPRIDDMIEAGGARRLQTGRHALALGDGHDGHTLEDEHSAIAALDEIGESREARFAALVNLEFPKASGPLADHAAPPPQPPAQAGTSPKTAERPSEGRDHGPRSPGDPRTRTLPLAVVAVVLLVGLAIALSLGL